MTDRISIRQKIRELAGSIISVPDNYSEDTILRILISESRQALEFVCTLEDEYDIEFDDDQINIEFFTNFDYIIDCIIRQSNNIE